MDAKQVVPPDAVAAKNGLPCTPLCKCYDKNCNNVIRDTHDILDDEDDD